MRVRDILKVSRRTFINPSAWLGYEEIKDQNRTLWSILRGLFTVTPPARTETFSAAVKRLQLSEADIRSTIKTYTWYAIGFSLLGLIIFIYAFYLLFRYGALLGCLLGLAVTILFLSQAFRYDFWAFQMRSRKLGRSFEEWKNDRLGVKKEKGKPHG